MLEAQAGRRDFEAKRAVGRLGQIALRTRGVVIVQQLEFGEEDGVRSGPAEAHVPPEEQDAAGLAQRRGRQKHLQFEAVDASGSVWVVYGEIGAAVEV